MQGECDRLAFTKQELEKALSEMKARTEELEKQHDEETEKYRLIEVPLSRMQFMSLISCIFPTHVHYYIIMYVCTSDLP